MISNLKEFIHAKWRFAIIATIVTVFFGFAFWDKNQEILVSKTLKIGETVLNIEVANTNAARIKGFSGRNSIRDEEGLLFVFDEEGYYGIWMKDMNFAIDIAWLDKDKKIIHIESSVEPDTYPKIFNSPTPALYVLEAKANFFEKNKIKIGETIKF